MDRKLSHSLTALSVTGICLAAALLASSPVEGDGRTTGPSAVALEAPADDPASGRPAPRASRGARRGLALPYFSFAHGMRRIGG
ncbi:hypothetical protein WCE34_04240 [Luteimonas sp. MJ204]|uniref:hypothetical protein n=1 Tax=Luteimonas sp. MJ145 TaxID=3129234 RepID=UPI0031BB5AF1